ncbi:MAG: aminotransferase class V-fold PLP-dependent enzyme [Candidatus Kapabacteria bacterium]|nr:aminotransferase class V-fold PLP-dependent enzyme [Candidatus Kapabacteria bacterium]
MQSRRSILGALTGTGLAMLNPSSFASVVRSLASFAQQGGSDIASDEQFWLHIQDAFDVDRSIINLNNGGVSPAPRVVMESLRQAMEYSNTAPSYTMWRHQEPNIELIRSQLAAMFAADSEEIAITRNASESLETLQLGIDLKRGDEVITTTQDYPRMLTTWDQRARRDGVIITKVDYPVPLLNHDDYVERIASAITPRTRIIHISHVCFMTGQILPVRRITDLARAKNIVCIVDGAHAFAQFPFTRAELGCDYYGCSLHKWLYGPIGTGFLYIQKDLIKNVWSLMASPKDMESNIRKFEEIGTHPAALHNALGAAVMFNQSLTLERKAARYRHLHNIWTERLSHYDNVKYMSNLADTRNWCGMITVNIEGTDLNKLQTYLFEKHRIFTVGITHEQFKGLRITPAVYTRAADMHHFADVMERVAQGKISEVKA